MGMADKMKEKAIPISSTGKSNVVVKQISRADAIALNIANAVVALQNQKENIAGAETFEGYKSIESPYIKELIK